MEPTEKVKAKIRARLRRAGFSVSHTENGDFLISGQGYTVRSYWDELFKQWRLVPYNEKVRRIVHETAQQYESAAS